MEVMKRISLIFALACIWISELSAQQSIGLRGDALFSNVSVRGIGDLVPDPDFITRPGFSLLYEKTLSDNLSIRTGLGYQERGFTAAAAYDLRLLGIDLPVGIRVITEVDYLTVPMELKLSLGNGAVVTPYLSAGVAASYATGARLREIVSLLVDINVGRQKINLSNTLFDRWELAGKAGLGLDIEAPNGKIFLEASYQAGLTNMLDDPILAIRLKNQNIAVGAGYRFFF